MASKNTLINKIKALDPEAEVENLTHKELSDMLKALNADDAPADDAPADDAPADDAAIEPDYPVVAKGKVISTLRGIIAEGEKILPKYLPGEEKTFTKLREKGYITDPLFS